MMVTLLPRGINDHIFLNSLNKIGGVWRLFTPPRKAEMGNCHGIIQGEQH